MRDLKMHYYKFFNPNPVIPKLSEEYLFTLPVFTDLHLLFKEPENRQNYINRSISYLYNLYDILEENQFKYFCQAGDIYDRGEKTLDIRIQNLYEHIFYLMTQNRVGYVVKGNHEDTYSRYNLFYAMTDIKSDFLLSQTYKNELLLPTHPYFKAIDAMTVGGIRFYFMHFDRDAKYAIKNIRKDQFNVAIFHEDIRTAETKEKLYHHKTGGGIDVEVTNIMDYIDIAICAHIHKPMTPFRLNNRRKTLIIIPGSICQRTREEQHNKVDIPVVCVKKDGTPTVEFLPFQLGDIADSMDIEVDEKKVKQRKMQKEIKKAKVMAARKINFEEYLNSLSPDIRQIVEEAKGELRPKIVEKYMYDKY